MIYLDCPYSDKDECKGLGGRWDNDAKKWYIPDGIDHSPFSKWIPESNEELLKKHEESKDIITLSPSSLDYQPKCPRCFYLDKVYNIKTKNFPPPVFSRFDVLQKEFFLNKNTSDLTSQLPSGKFFLEGELPGKILSDTLKDEKGRKFKLGGIPDLVIKFDNGEFGIIDFKTTKFSPDKCDSYKYQLEAYAQIFENPGKTQTKETPLLTPISHLGILQFDPNKIITSDDFGCNMIMKMDYSPLEKRDPDEFYKRISNILDILHSKSIPELSEDCGDCNFFIKQTSIPST